MTALTNSNTFYVLLMLFAGVGIPIMATLNAGLGARLQSPALAVSILLVVAFFISVMCLLYFDGVSRSLISASTYYPQTTPFYFYLGGVFFVFYILSITWVMPKFGVGNAIACVLLGQIISIAAIDHFGLLGANQLSLSAQRFMGLVLMCIGVFLAVRK